MSILFREHKVKGVPITPPSTGFGSGVGVIEEADLCQTPEDYFGFKARSVVGLLLRSQLDAGYLTPTELLHDHKSLKAMVAQRMLVEAAIDRVAALQARVPGQDLRGRRVALQAAVDDIVARALKAERTLEGVAKNGPAFAVLYRDQGIRAGDSAEQDHLLCCALARELAGMQGWARKLIFLVSLATDDSSGRVATLVDGALADLVAAGTVLTEIFSPAALPGAALRRNLELALTEMPRPMDVGPKPQYALNALLFAGKLPETRHALLERVRRQLRTTQPLGTGRREEEIRLFYEILSLVVGPEGVAGGGGMAEALVMRYSRRLDQGGATALRLSTQGIVESLSNLLSRLQFLAALAASEAGVKLRNEVVQTVDALADNAPLIEAAVFKPYDPEALRAGLECAAAAFDQTGFPGETKARLRQRITGMMDAFVARGSFLDLMDKAEPVVSRRVEALSALLATDLLSALGGRPLVEQQIAQLQGAQGGSLQGAMVTRSALTRAAPLPLDATFQRDATVQVDALRQTDARVVARFGRHRCPSCFETKTGCGMCMVCGHDESEGGRPGVHLQPGTLLEGRYVVGRLIGQGGFGATYLGWDERLMVKVAIKEYFPVTLASRSPATGALIPYTENQVATFKEGIIKFLEEARLLARLRDVKEIVKVHDQFEANATAYMVMELLVGRTLQRHLLEEGGSIDYRRALSLILPIAKAVHDVHQLGMVHRDISPDNIFLLDRGEPKLLDFGAARHCVGEATGALTVILKRGYAPPEQYASDSHQGPWTDVYALCATFYCAITGRPPPDATARWGDDDALVRPSKLGIAIPSAVEDALFAGLALRWQDRPRDMKILLQSFSRALSE